MFKVGDRVRVKTTGQQGVVQTIFPAEYWGIIEGDDEYAVLFDSGGSINMRDSILELVNVPKCECGAKFTSFQQIHSDWCPFYEKV